MKMIDIINDATDTTTFRQTITQQGKEALQRFHLVQSVYARSEPRQCGRYDAVLQVAFDFTGSRSRIRDMFNGTDVAGHQRIMKALQDINDDWIDDRIAEDAFVTAGQDALRGFLYHLFGMNQKKKATTNVTPIKR